MSRYNDPTEVHGCECARCLNWQHDNELDVNSDGYCWSCVEEMEEVDDPVSDLYESRFSDIRSESKQAQEQSQ